MAQRKQWSTIIAVIIATASCLVVFGGIISLVQRFQHRNEYHGRTLEAWLPEVNSANREIKEEALNVFVEAGVKAVPMLIHALNAPDASAAARVQAISALSVLGGKANRATTDLMNVLNHTNSSVRGAAFTALGNVTTDSSKLVTACIKILSDPSPTLRIVAAKRLQKMPSLIKPAVPALQKACSDPDKRVREAAASVLESVNIPVPGANDVILPPPQGN